MKFNLLKSKDSFDLIFERDNQDKLDNLTFNLEMPNISNRSGWSVLIGKEKQDTLENKWLDFSSKQLQAYDKGDIEIKTDSNFYTDVELFGNRLSGIWTIGRGKEKVMMWKNPEKNKETIHIDKIIKSDDIKTQKKEFVFNSILKYNTDHNFSGTAMETGLTNQTQNGYFFFTEDNIKKAGKIFKENLGNIKVDYNHDKKDYNSYLTNALIYNDKIDVEGYSEKGIRKGLGLSASILGDAYENTEHGVKFFTDIEDIQFLSILEQDIPGCKSCFIQGGN